MEKFKWFDFDPIKDGDIKPKGIIDINENCGNAGISCQTLKNCEYTDVDLFCIYVPGQPCVDYQRLHCDV